MTPGYDMRAHFGGALVDLLPGCTEWSDEQWAEHDAKVAAERELESNRYRSPPTDWRARGLSQRAVDAVATADHQAPAMAAVARWHEANPRDGIAVVSGPAGCGKTVAATWWAMQVGALAVRASAFATSSRYDHETRNAWLDARALVLDDLGTEYADAKGSFLTDLDELINAKYENRDRLVITTNCTADEFRGRYGARVIDRLRECGTWLSIAGSSLRRKP